MSVGERAEKFNGDDDELSWTVCVCRHTVEDGRLRNLSFIEGKVIHVVWNICELKRTKEELEWMSSYSIFVVVISTLLPLL